MFFNNPVSPEQITTFNVTSFFMLKEPSYCTFDRSIFNYTLVKTNDTFDKSEALEGREDLAFKLSGTYRETLSISL